MWKKIVPWVMSFLFIYSVISMVSQCSAGYVQANLNARANTVTKRLSDAQARIATLSAELASLKSDSAGIASATGQADSTNKNLGRQIDQSLGYLDGTQNQLDRIDAIVHAVQKRSDVAYSAGSVSKH